MPDCFVIMPITTPTELVERYGGDRVHFEHVFSHLFEPAIEGAGYTAIPPAAEGADLIQAEIVRRLESADLVLCDISTLNANVFFELGIRTALDRAVCLVRDDLTPSLPFDTGIINCHTYKAGLSAWDLGDEIESLANHIRAVINRSKGRNALWRYFGLTQRGSDAIASVEDQSVGATLDLLLAEMREIKRGAGSPRQATTRPRLDPGDARGNFLRLAELIAAEISASLTTQTATDDRIVFDLRTFIVDDERRERIVVLGRMYGFEVEFVNGRTL